MTANASGYTPSVLYVQKNIPVKWVINGEQLTSCNNAIVVPTMDIEKKLESGENIINFTPGDKDINFSCWMGMIGGVIKVVDDIKAIDATSADATETNPAAPSGPSIYGSDLAKTPIDILVKKSKVSNNTQSLTISGIGYELSPIIAVMQSGVKANLSFDLTKFDNADGLYSIIDADSKTISSFQGKKGINQVVLTFDKPGVYGIIKGNTTLGLIDVSEDIKPIVLEDLRDKYLK